MSGPFSLKSTEHRVSVSGEATLPPVSAPPPPKPAPGFSQLPQHATTIQQLHDPTLQAHDADKQQHVADWLYHTQQHRGSQEDAPPGGKVQSKKVSPPKKSVYLSETCLEFPKTAVGSQVTVKVRVCNRDTVTHHFTVIKPSKPFSVNHFNFSLE